MAKSVGLDIGSRTLKLVEVDGSPKKYKVTNFFVKDIPGEGGGAEGEIVVQTLRELLKEAKFRSDSIITAINAGSVVIREILVPFLQDDQIRKVLRFEAEAHLHNYAIEDVVVDYLKVGELKDQSKVLIFAAPKDRIRERLVALNSNGIDPMFMSLDLTALFNAAKASGNFDEHPNSVVLDIGATTTNILFVRQGELKSCRSLRTGSESVTRVLAQDLAVDTDAARERTEKGDQRPREDDLLKPLSLDDEEETIETEKSADELESAIVVQRQDDFLTRIHRETTRSLASYSADHRVTMIYMTGGASLAGGVDRRLAERFGLPVEQLTLLRDQDDGVAAADFETANALAGVALGCAVQGLGYEGVNLEFRREDMRYTRKFDLIKVAMASTVSLIFILLFLNWLNAQNTLRIRRQETAFTLNLVYERYVKDLKEQYKTVLEKKDTDLPASRMEEFAKFGAWQAQVNKMHKHITSELGFNVQGVPPIRSALVVWKDLFVKLEEKRKEIGYLLLDDFRVTQKELSFGGLIGNRAQVDTILVQVKLMGCVKEAEIGSTSVDKKTKKIKFDVRAALKPTLSKNKR
jgi:type IV pilus assembly protein PilM